MRARQCAIKPLEVFHVYYTWATPSSRAQPRLVSRYYCAQGGAMHGRTCDNLIVYVAQRLSLSLSFFSAKRGFRFSLRADPRELSQTSFAYRTHVHRVRVYRCASRDHKFLSNFFLRNAKKVPRFFTTLEYRVPQRYLEARRYFLAGQRRLFFTKMEFNRLKG